MKYIKLFMFLAVAAVFAACSDDDASWNTNADVTVGMKEAAVSVKEGKGLFNVPIAVTGETNAPVRVTVSVKGSGANPATKDVNYLVTDTVIVISGTEGNVEIKTVDDEGINEDRTFEVSIVSAQGAQVDASKSTCAVTLRDNDSEFYEKLQGNYVMTCTNLAGTASYKWNVTVTGGDEDTEDYNKYLYVSGMMGYSWTSAVLVYDYDKATQTGSISFGELGSYIFADGVSFNGVENNPCSIALYSLNGNKLVTDPVVGAWSDDFNTITFNPAGALYGAIFDSTNAYVGGWFNLTKIVMTRK